MGKWVAKPINIDGVLAQLGEHLPYKQRVIGSSPIGPIIKQNVHECQIFKICADMAQFLDKRVSACRQSRTTKSQRCQL